MKYFIKNPGPFFTVLIVCTIFCSLCIHCEQGMEPPTIYEGEEAYISATETPSFIFFKVGFRRDKTIGISDKAVYKQTPPDWEENKSLINNLSSDDNYYYIVIKFVKEELEKNKSIASFTLIFSNGSWVDINPNFSSIWMPKIGNDGGIGRVYVDLVTKQILNYNRTRFVCYMDVRDTDYYPINK